MQLKTVKEVLHWTTRFHVQLGECLLQCAGQQHQEQSQLVLRQLAEHEQKLSNLMADHEASAKASVLNTWIYEFLDTTREKSHSACLQPFETLDAAAILVEVEFRHIKVIDLYRSLLDQAPIASVGVLLEEVLHQQQHELQEMKHCASQLEYAP